MRETLKDPLRLEHMLEAIDKLIQAQTRDDFENLTEKDLEYFGIVKLLEIIGEAAYKLTVEFKDNHPETPWKYIIAMRHILVHGYYQIKRQDVFKTIKENLPQLRTQISNYLIEYEE
ncbi:MAG: DUF86 domain-containing protein [Muribaculaceae bacterium]|nr:DUF86 domain-containing protein [Muribaculaceae bacterium]